MPWDEAMLKIARFPKPAAAWTFVAEALPVAVSATIGKPKVSYSSPQWSPDGKHLAFTSDESGWRSLWIGGAEGENAARVETGEARSGSPTGSRRGTDTAGTATARRSTRSARPAELRPPAHASAHPSAHPR